MRDNILSNDDLGFLEAVEECLSNKSSPAFRQGTQPVVCRVLIDTVPHPREEFRHSLWLEIDAPASKAGSQSIPGRLRRVLSPTFIATLIGVLLFLLWLSTPWGRAIAQQVIEFFTRTESDVVPGSALRSDAPSPTDYEGIEAAEEAVGFKSFQPSWLPDDFHFHDVNADMENGIINSTYLGPRNDEGVVTPQFTLTQRLTPFAFPIGPSAEIVPLDVNGMPAQYVVGGWLYIGDTREAENDSARRDERYYQWEERMLPFPTLRWNGYGFYFEISYTGSCTVPGCLSTEDLVAIAESLE